jgi:regulator of RNase E activity RraA
MAATARALGTVGCVCDGGLRDILEIKQFGDFHLFSPGFVVSHGNPVICDVGVGVELEGLQIQPGDLLHGDVNGLLVVPEDIAEQIPAEAARLREEEKRILDFVRSSDFSLDSLREMQQKFRH